MSVLLLDDESGTATEDEEDVRARELRKKEVWLQVPPRSSDTDTGSETEVKDSQDCIDLVVAQGPLISLDCKVIPSSVSNGSEPLSDINNRGGSPESSNAAEVILASNEATSMCNQDMTSVDKNGTFDVISQASQDVILAVSSCVMPNNVDDNILSLNGFLVPSMNIAANEYSDKEDWNSEYESFIDENSQLDLSSLNSPSYDKLQNNILDVNATNINLSATDLIINVNDSATNVDNSTGNFALGLSVDNIQENFIENDQIYSKQIAGITLENICTPCAGTGKDIKVSESETIINVDDLPGVITSSLRESRNSSSSSSSSSEIYRSTEVLPSDSVVDNYPDDLTNCSKSDLPKKIELERANISFINKDENSLINENRDISLIDRSNNIRVNDVADTKISARTVIASVLPLLMVTSPSPTQEKQFEEELIVKSSKLLTPQDSRDIPSFSNCDNSFDRLKRDLKQRKAKNRAIGDGLRPLSAEHARLKMNKYFVENRKDRPTRTEKVDDEMRNVEIVKLDIRPKLSSKVNAEKMLKYFNKPNSTSSDKSKACNATKITVEQDERRNLEIDIEGINDINEKDIDVIEQQFHQIEEQNEIAYSVENNSTSFPLNLTAFECGKEVISDDEEKVVCDDKKLVVCDKKEVVCNDLDLTCNDLVELHPKIVVDNTPMVSQESFDTHVINSHVDLENDILKLSTSVIFDNVLRSCTDVESNAQISVTNENKGIEKIDSTENILEADIENINEQKEIKVELNDNMLENNDIIIQENATEIILQSNIIYTANNIEEKKVNPLALEETVLNDNINGEKQTDKNIPSDDIPSGRDKDKKSSENLLFQSSILNTKLPSKTPLPLENNTNKIVRGNALHKSDTALNKNRPYIIDRKNTSNNSRSLSELRDTLRENASTVKVIVAEKVIDAFMNRNTSNNSTQNRTEEVPKRPERKHFYHDTNALSKNNTTEALNFITTSYTELSPPEIPARKKFTKKSFKISNGNQGTEDTPKLQSKIIENTTKLHNQINNNLHDQNIKDGKLQDRDPDDISKTRDIPSAQNRDVKNIVKPPRQNAAKLRAQNVTNISSVGNEIKVKDTKDISIARNRSITDTQKSYSQDKSVESSQGTHHSLNRCLPDKLEESAKFTSSNDQSKREKCIIS